MAENFRGIVLPTPTVFLDDGRVDEKLMSELTEGGQGALRNFCIGK